MKKLLAVRVSPEICGHVHAIRMQSQNKSLQSTCRTADTPIVSVTVQ